MGRHFPLVRMLELIGSSDGWDFQDICNWFPEHHPRAIGRILTRFHRFAILKHTRHKTHPKGRWPYRWRLKKAGYEVLELVKDTEARYGLTYRQIRTLADALKIVSRVALLRTKIGKNRRFVTY